MPQAQTCAHAAPVRAEPPMEPSMSSETLLTQSGAAPVPDSRNAATAGSQGRRRARHARLIKQPAHR